MWPASFALEELTAAEEKKIARAREESGELRLQRLDRFAQVVERTKGAR